MVVLAGRTNAAATAQAFQSVRTNVTNLGDPLITAALHILLGEMEAKRGLIESARRHTRLGLSILSPQRNLWLESVAKNNLVAIAIMLCDLRQGIDLAERGRDLAEESGSAARMRAFVAKWGDLYYR